MDAVKIKNMEDLDRIRDSGRDMTAAKSRGQTRIILGMGTCGIAAGGKKILEAVESELRKRGLSNVTIESTGCIGVCQNEPLLDIIRPGEPRITYGNLKPEDVPRIISEHIVNGRVVEDKVLGRLS